jgi:hypothetical protein
VRHQSEDDVHGRDANLEVIVVCVVQNSVDELLTDAPRVGLRQSLTDILDYLGFDLHSEITYFPVRFTPHLLQQNLKFAHLPLGLLLL